MLPPYLLEELDTTWDAAALRVAIECFVETVAAAMAGARGEAELDAFGEAGAGPCQGTNVAESRVMRPRPGAAPL